MRDAIEFEWAGRHAVAIISEEFVPGAESMRRVSQMGSYPFAIAEEGVGRLSPEQLKQRAEALIPQILDCLLNREISEAREDQNEGSDNE